MQERRLNETDPNPNVRHVSFNEDDDVRVGRLMTMVSGDRSQWRVTDVDRKARVATLERVPWEQVGLNRKQRRAARKEARK